MCQMLSIGRSAYYAWLKRKPGSRKVSNERLDQKIRAIFTAHKGRYGAVRITEELRDEGECCSKKRVAKRMEIEKIYFKLRG